MIYPANFEIKIGFHEVREMLKARCLSPLGQQRADAMSFLADASLINAAMEQIREMKRIRTGDEDFPLNAFFDIRDSMKRLRMAGTFLEEDELFELMRTLDTLNGVVAFLKCYTDDEHATLRYPALAALTEGVIPMPQIVKDIDRILDKFGHIKDNASPQLAEIRRELSRTKNSISRILNGILRSAQSDGLVDKDVAPTLRDGRLVLPVAPGVKRKIGGIVHDESASGRTVYVEPAEVVEANNRIRELESDERHEIIRILKEVANDIRPHVEEILFSLNFLADIDFVQARTSLSEAMGSTEPHVEPVPLVDWMRARHPLLDRRLRQQNSGESPLVPLDIQLSPEQRMLIISGPNAGGKSVCLKTVGLLQYMVQCGLGIPVDERSKIGVFSDIMIDIGDEQSLENDLSTYSSHLLNMKNMLRQANSKTLILIDEFGTGTEPNIGGAIAESVLGLLLKEGAWGVITTHYQNLKHFADGHPGVANGAMLYDRHEMKPLFQLSIGRPGSSFAIEIARKIGLPEEVIREASQLVGTDYIQSDKYLQDIVRDKRYWENKRTNIHQREKDLDRQIERYEHDIERISQQRREILQKAKQEAEELLRESNRRIENTIREIKESQAEKENTRRIRDELEKFKHEVSDIDTQANDEMVARKIAQIQQRRERRQQRKQQRASAQQQEQQLQEQQRLLRQQEQLPLQPGDHVRIKGTSSIGQIERIDGRLASVICGGMRTRLRLERLERASTAAVAALEAETRTKSDELKESLRSYNISHLTQQTIDDHRKNFHQDLDVRGMRGDEALNAVQHFVDDAILMGMQRVRILHGKGNGILRQLIRQYLATVPNVTHYADEHVQFGGSGITVVDF